ncbi:MAG: dihydroorotate dehydrogenase [Deltaproteobacteria bacterium]|nr:dihydroorotate dehydrogenase [Deltaproteobacteria bacterium]
MIKKAKPKVKIDKKAALALEVEIAGLELRNPVMTASGTFGYGSEFAPYTDLEKLGAIIVKGLSLKPRHGNPSPRIVETPCGMLNAIGLQNVGVEAFIKNKLLFLRKLKTPVIANIFGETVDDYRELALRLEDAGGVAALEINISCPNVKKGGIAFGTDPVEAHKVVSAVTSAVRLPVITKLSPNVTDIRVMVRAVQDAGTNAITLINTIPGLVVDVEKRRPMLANVIGGLSGPAIRPIAVRMVWEAKSVAKVPLIGSGGIISANDALEFILAWATAVQVGTANFLDPDAAVKVAVGIAGYCKRHNAAVKSLVGGMKARE